MDKKIKELISNMMTHIDSKSFKEKKVAVFSVIKGQNYNNNLLFYGRSLNGWSKGISTKKLNDKKSIKQSLYELECTEDDGMDWVWQSEGDKKEYNTNKSAFFRVMKLITCNSKKYNKQNWSTYIAWSNLYKLCPSEKGNPSIRLRDNQLQYVKDIFYEEINSVKPKNVILLTGLRWAAPFLYKCHELNISKTNKYVEYVGKYKKTNIIVGQHPQGKNEESHVKEILKYISI